jgi:protein-tyrosine phosphatase
MIDTHLHILPGVDDGPETIEETLSLARVLVKEGIHSAFATPHYNDMFPQRSATEIRERVYDVQQVLDSEGILLRLFAGHEALIKAGLAEDIQAGRLATLNNSRYLLLELWNSVWLPETERVIFELKAGGIIPIIAHPERYHAIQQDPDRLTPLVQQGVLAQLTASSLIGGQGNTTRRCAEVLLRKGLVHFIASDAHDLATRPPAITRSLKRATELVGQVRVDQMIETYPSAIVSNGVLENLLPQDENHTIKREGLKVLLSKFIH